jgi:hypothetical protein
MIRHGGRPGSGLGEWHNGTPTFSTATANSIVQEVIDIYHPQLGVLGWTSAGSRKDWRLVLL